MSVLTDRAVESLRKIHLFVRFCRFSLVPLLVLAACADPRSRPVDEVTGAIRDVTVIDGTGAMPRLHQTIVVRDSVIERVGDADSIDSSDMEVIDGRGRFLIPGLIDMHAHTMADERLLRLYLANGVTTIRDMGCPPECAEQLRIRRDAFREGHGSGPRIRVTGPNIDGNSPFNYPGHINITSETAAESVTQLKSAGADFIKVRDWLSLEEYDAVMSAAHSGGLPVVGHVAVAVPLLHALASGQKTIEHNGSLLGGVLLACSSREDELRGISMNAMNQGLETKSVIATFAGLKKAGYFNQLVDSYDEEKAGRLVQAFRDSGSAWVPTLLVHHPDSGGSDPVFDGRRKIDDPSLHYVPKEMVEVWKQDRMAVLFDQHYQAVQSEGYRKITRLIQQMHQAGVPILAGTDAAMMMEVPWKVPGFSLHDELLLLVEAGLDPVDAIVAGSSAAARVMELHDVGTITAGARADLILLDADPHLDIRNTRSIQAVISNGEVFTRAALDGMLKESERW
jgi:imidazolonepropionase-like amidohydrolase